MDRHLVSYDYYLKISETSTISRLLILDNFLVLIFWENGLYNLWDCYINKLIKEGYLKGCMLEGCPEKIKNTAYIGEMKVAFHDSNNWKIKVLDLNKNQIDEGFEVDFPTKKFLSYNEQKIEEDFLKRNKIF